MNVDGVVGTELHTVGNQFSGLLSSSSLLVKHMTLLKEYFGDRKPDVDLESSSLDDDPYFFESRLDLAIRVYVSCHISDTDLTRHEL